MRRIFPQWHITTGRILLVILVFSFAARLWRLSTPPGYVFDEVYHAVTAKLIARNDHRAFEWWNPPVEPNTAVDWLHPPYAKYTQAVGMLIFGENSFGWRISAALFGVGVIYLTYLVALELWQKPKIAVLAAGLASLDGLLLVMSRVAMNDIHVTFFIMLTLWSYLRYCHHKLALWWVGVSIGLAVGTKWSGVFGAGLIWMLEGQRLFTYYMETPKLPPPAVKIVVKTILLRLGALLLVPLLLYLASYWLMFAQGKGLTHLRDLHQQIWWYQTSLTATHTYQSRPEAWFFNWRPVWFYVEYGEKSIANIYAFANPALVWFGDMAVVATIFMLGWHFIKSPVKSMKTSPLLTVLLAYLIVWLPWIRSPRIMFFYHYTPAIPFLCILLAYWLWRFSRQGYKVLAAAVVLVCVVCFFVWYPDWTALPVPMWWAEHIYFILPNWR